MRNGTTTTYTYDNNNRLISEVSSSQVKSYTYDANGNQLTAISNGNYAGAYTYDLWNMQATYTVDGTGITNYTYRPDGLRHSVQGKVHIWDNGNIIADIGSDTVYYIRALTLIYSQRGDTKTYYRFNGHGDVIALANANGAIIKQYKYDAFGVEENPGVFDTNVFRYCAEYFDVETNTIYLRARYYDAQTGRFTQQDGWNYAVPGFLLSLNLYTYCWNNPICFIDSTGNAPFPNWAKKFIAAAAVVATVAAVAAICVATAGAGSFAAAVAIGAAKGAALGALSGAANGAITGGISGVIQSRIETGGWDNAGQAFANGALNGAADGALNGAITGAVTGGVKGGINYNKGSSATSALTDLDNKQELSSKEKRIKILEENKKKGKNYEDEQFEIFKQTHPDAERQITIKTAFNKKTRVDAIGHDINGNLEIMEFKSSATAKLSKNQICNFTNLKKAGGVIIGKGKNVFKGGVIIDPVTVLIQRPGLCLPF